MSKRHSERCESRSNNNLGKNNKGIMTTKSKLSPHDRVHTYLDYVLLRNKELLNVLMYSDFITKAVTQLSNAHA
jgi:hypothetical protein